jgi:hypothetical protein
MKGAAGVTGTEATTKVTRATCDLKSLLTDMDVNINSSWYVVYRGPLQSICGSREAVNPRLARIVPIPQKIHDATITLTRV